MTNDNRFMFDGSDCLAMIQFWTAASLVYCLVDVHLLIARTTVEVDPIYVQARKMGKTSRQVMEPWSGRDETVRSQRWCGLEAIQESMDGTTLSRHKHLFVFVLTTLRRSYYSLACRSNV